MDTLTEIENSRQNCCFLFAVKTGNVETFGILWHIVLYGMGYRDILEDRLAPVNKNQSADIPETPRTKAYF